MKLLAAWATATFALFVADRLLSKMHVKDGLKAHLVVGALYGVCYWGLGLLLWPLNALLTVGTFGLYRYVLPLVMVLVGALALKLADKMSDRLTVETSGTALIASGIVALVTWGVQLVF